MPSAERRTVTIPCSGRSGFTSLPGTMGPGDVRDPVEALFARFRPGIEAPATVAAARGV